MCTVKINVRVPICRYFPDINNTHEIKWRELPVIMRLTMKTFDWPITKQPEAILYVLFMVILIVYVYAVAD